MSQIDFGRHSEDYAEYRPGYPSSFYERTEAITPIKDARTVDLAAGPGTIALELGARGSSVVGVDVSAELIATAIRLSKERNLEGKVHFQVSSAENTGLDSSSFDMVIAGQCWHWFDSAAAMSEVWRVLRPGGVLAIAYNSYLAERSQLVRETEELILRFNPSWTMAGSKGRFPEISAEVSQGEFRVVEEIRTDHEEQFSHACWRGRMRTSNGVGSGGLSPSDVLRFDDALERLLENKYAEPTIVEHRVWCVVARKQP